MEKTGIKLEPKRSFLITGPSHCGKSYFIFKFLLNIDCMYLEKDIPEKIYYFYGVYQDLFNEMKERIRNIEFHEGVPSLEYIQALSTGDHILIILDDLIHQISKSQDMELILTRELHHRNISLMNISQNMYYSGKNMRTINLNTSYMVIFKNNRDQSQIGYLARQILPKNYNSLVEAYYDSTSIQPYGYLFLDFTQRINDKLRVRTNIFPGEDMIIYIPKSDILMK